MESTFLFIKLVEKLIYILHFPQVVTYVQCEEYNDKFTITEDLNS